MTNPSRRAVLRAGVAFAAVSVPLSVAKNALSVVAPPMGAPLRRGTFQPHVGTTFRFVGAGGTHEAVLEAVDDVKTARKAHRDVRFRLLWQSEGLGPEQGTYRLEHPDMPVMELFVTPVGAKPGVSESVVDARS